MIMNSGHTLRLVAPKESYKKQQMIIDIKHGRTQQQPVAADPWLTFWGQTQGSASAGQFEARILDKLVANV